METPIDYLNKVHGDLLDAAKRERARLRVVGRPRRAPSSALVAAMVAVLVAAGLLGIAVRSHGVDEATQEAAGSTGGAATGATGAVEPGTLARPSHDGVPSEVGEGAPSVARIIRTAEITLVVPPGSFDERFAEAVGVAENLGGFVADSRTRKRSGSLTLRVPADAFNESLRAVRGLGTVDVESVHGEDVTAQYVDLHARLRIARARRDVLLGLMEDATTIEQTIRVQNALDETQLRIEQLQGQISFLNDRTSLATIRLAMREKGVEPESEVETPSIPNAFERAAAGSVGVIAAIVIGLGYLLPLLAIGLVIWFVVVRVRRRRAD